MANSPQWQVTGHLRGAFVSRVFSSTSIHTALGDMERDFPGIAIDSVKKLY